MQYPDFSCSSPPRPSHRVTLKPKFFMPRLAPLTIFNQIFPPCDELQHPPNNIKMALPISHLSLFLSRLLVVFFDSHLFLARFVMSFLLIFVERVELCYIGERTLRSMGFSPLFLLLFFLDFLRFPRRRPLFIFFLPFILINYKDMEGIFVLVQ